MAKKVIKSDVLQDRSESHGLITSEAAALLLGVQKASFFAIAYEHAEELGAFRMGGIILCEKAKCESFAEKRAARNADKSANNRRKELVSERP